MLGSEHDLFMPVSTGPKSGNLKICDLSLKFQTCRFSKKIHNSEYSGPGKRCQQQDNNRLMDKVNHQ
jgi:hypothetical protein